MAFQPFSHKEIRHFFVFFWLFAFVLLQITFQYFFHLQWGIAFTDNVVSIILLILFIGIINKTDHVSKLHGYQFIPAFILITIFSALCLAVNTAILYYLNLSHNTYQAFLFKSLPFRFSYIWFIITGFTFTNYVWQKASERKREQQKVENLRKIAREAELDKIYQQLHPHFLFNSLNAINTLIVSYPNKATDMIQKLSDFLRGSLKKVNEECIPLEDEIGHLRLYLELEEIRFGERLKTKISFKKGTSQSTIPPLVLQPLIENAVKFGLYGTLGKVTIHLKSYVFKNHLYLLISNPFSEDTQPPQGTGFGLKSVKRRLFLIYGRNDLIQTKKRENTFTIYLKIPQHYDKSYNY